MKNLFRSPIRHRAQAEGRIPVMFAYEAAGVSEADIRRWLAEEQLPVVDVGAQTSGALSASIIPIHKDDDVTQMWVAQWLLRSMQKQKRLVVLLFDHPATRRAAARLLPDAGCSPVDLERVVQN